MFNARPFQQPEVLNRSVGNDPAFSRTVSGVLHAAFGADPATGQTLPGPISHLSARLQGEMDRGGMPALGHLFPEPAHTAMGPPGGDRFEFSGASGLPAADVVSGPRLSRPAGGPGHPTAPAGPVSPSDFPPTRAGSLQAGQEGPIGMALQLAGMLMLMLQSTLNSLFHGGGSRSIQ